jgi:16S rRNA G966 N2-methylase RsmD
MPTQSREPEAAQRAASVVFVDEDARAAALIGRNLAHCRIAEGYVMIRAEFTRALRQLAADRRFDLALLDVNLNGRKSFPLADLLAKKLDRLFKAGSKEMQKAIDELLTKLEIAKFALYEIEASGFDENAGIAARAVARMQEVK